MAFEKPIPQAEWVFLFVEARGQRGRTTKQRKEGAMIQVVLTYEDVHMPREIVANHFSELRMEIT